MIMEYAEGGELFDYIIKKDHLSENETRNIFHQLIDTVDYMHQMGICHRDLKPENILLDSSQKYIKIIDFGLSNLYYTKNINDYIEEFKFEDKDEIKNNYNDIEIDLLETPCGSPGYAPPEMVMGYPYDGLLTDIWSSGIILYAMLCGSFPFDDDSEQILYSKIIKGVFDFPSDIILSEEAKNLVNKILVVNPRKRASISEIKNDPWFKKNYKPIYGLFLPIQEIPIDNLIIKEMEKNGYKKEEIIKNVKNNRHNEITTFYYLLAKKFSRNGVDTVNNLISPSFCKYILEQNEKLKCINDYKILINLKLIFEKIKLDEAERTAKLLEKEISKNIKKENPKNKENENNDNTLKDNIKERKIEKEKEKEKEKQKEKVKEININKNEEKDNFTMGVKPKQETNMNKYINNFSLPKEENVKYLNNSNIYKKKENPIKNYRNIILGSLHKNKKFKKLTKIKDKKESNKNYLKKLKLNSYSLEKNNHSHNKNQFKTSMNIKKDTTINLSFPFPETDMAITTKRDKININKGINTSRINTDRINYEKYFSIKPNIKTVINKVNCPLYQKFTLNCKENAYKKRKFQVNQGFISKVIKNSKTSSFNSYVLNNNLKIKLNNNTNSIKNMKIKNILVKNTSIQKEKGNMSHRQIQKDKTLFDYNLSKILTASEEKSYSHSKGKGKDKINTPFSSRNKNEKKFKNKINKNNGEFLCYKKIKKFNLLDNKDRKPHDFKINSNKTNENDNNNINFSININLNLNQIKNSLKEREKTTSLEQKKKKSLKWMKLDLKKINNNYQIYNRNHLTNSERINNDNILKIKNNLIYNTKKDYINNTKSMINATHTFISNNYKNNSHSKDDKKYKNIDNNKIFKKKELKQKSFNYHNKKTNLITNSLTKLLPFLKSMNIIKTKSTLKKESPNFNKKAITVNNNSNSVLINNANNTIINNNQNKKFKLNPKLEQMKQNKKLINTKILKNISNYSYHTEVPIIHYNLSHQDKNNSQKSPPSTNIKMKPLNLKGLINESKNSYVCKSLTMRGEQAKNKIIMSMKHELIKRGNNINKIKNRDENISIHIINKVSPNKNIINNDAVFEMNPIKIKNILLTQLPKYNITISRKSSKNNYFIFHCLKGLVKLIIELLKIKRNNSIFVQIKYFSGNQKEFLYIRKQILGIIHNFKNNI